MPTKLCFTGRLKVGKDYVAHAVGAKVFGFADPMYAVAQYFFGTADKDAPGMRAFLQTIGQWGRGELNEQYLFTPERALFVGWMRGAMKKALPDIQVNWDQYGRTTDLWVDSLVQRIAVETQTDVLAVSNIRFPNELNRLQAEGFIHYHVMCSPVTHRSRLQAAQLAPGNPVLNDMSEKFAFGLDRQVVDLIKRQPRGPKLRAVWNDEVAPPSGRLLTLNEFTSQVNGQPARETEVAPEPDIPRKRNNPGRMPASMADMLDRMTGLDCAEVEQQVADRDTAVKHFVERSAA